MAVILAKALILLSSYLIYLSNAASYSLSGFTLESSKHNQTVQLEVDTNNKTVRITMVGKSTEWMGTGWGSHEMDHTYTIVADGNDNTVSEWSLHSSSRGDELKKTITVVSNTVVGEKRTVVVTRAAEGAENGYYNFPTEEEKIEIIWAYGPSSQPVYSKSTEMSGHGELYLDLKKVDLTQ